MKVAIIGAGWAGVVCAHQFERRGIFPDIFEMQNHVAEPYSHIGSTLQIGVRPVKDPIKYLNDTYALNINPLCKVKKVIHYGPSTRATISGDLGYFLARGAEENSITRELSKNIKSKIQFNKFVDYKELKDKYDYVIIASGRPTEAKELGVWQDFTNTWVKGAIVLGDFETDTLTVWINKDYCRSGYAYLTPFDKNRASLVLVVTDSNKEEIEEYWEKFIITENIGYRIVETFKRTHDSGHVYPHIVDNIYLIGDAGGSMDPFLGFGVFASAISAGEVANSILDNKNYEKQIKFAVDLNLKMHEFRKAFNSLDNNGYDRLIKSLNLPGVNPIIYNTNINVTSLGSISLKMLNFIFSDNV